MIDVCYQVWHSNVMKPPAAVDMRVHIAEDDETGRWYIVQSDVPGLRLEADDAVSLIRRIELAAPELAEANASEIERLHGIVPGSSVRIVPVFDSPIQIAA